jgi:hypothetical protein
MSRYLLAAFAIALAAPGLTAAPVPPAGGKGTVFPYPAKAPLVVCLNGYDKARDRLNKMLTAALPKDAAMIAKLLDDQLDKLLKDRKLTAVRKDARGFLVLNDLAGLIDGNPALSVLVPISTYKEFLESFLTKDEFKTLEKGRGGVDLIKTFATGEEQTAYLVDLKEYVAITTDKDTADAYAAKYTAGSSDDMGSDLAETFVKADLALYVNMEAINEKFGDQIRAFKGLIDFALQQAQQQGALQALSKKQIDAMKVIFKGLLQGVEDCRAVVVAGEFRPDGLMVRLQARFADDSLSAKLLASEQPSALTDLGKLPGGLGIYQASHFGKTIGELLQIMSQEFVTTEDDARGAELLEQHLKDLADAGPGAEFTASLLPGSAISVVAFKDADKAAKALSKAYKAVGAGGRVNGVVVKTAPRVGDEAEKAHGFVFTSVNLNFDFEASVAGLPDAIKDATLETMKRQVNEKTTHWIGSNGKVVVRLTAKDWNAAKELLDKFIDGKGSLASNPGFKRVRGQLPAEANLLVVAEVEAALTGAITSMKAMSQAIPGFPKLGPLKKSQGGEATYVGLAVTLKNDVATVTAYVPVEAMTAGRSILESLFKKIE